MEIQVKRFTSDADTTISQIFVDGQFVCFGLEDEFRVKKVENETRIPAQKYGVGVRTAGKHHLQYMKRFQEFHKGMLHILNVPNFEYILIHCGNTHADTSGCLLVGMGAVTDPENMSISNSVTAYKKLYTMVIDSALAGTLSIVLIDDDQ